MYNLENDNNKNKLTDTHSSLVIPEEGLRVNEMSEGGRKVQISCYKMSMSRGFNVQHRDYS